MNKVVFTLICQFTIAFAVAAQDVYPIKLQTDDGPMQVVKIKGGREAVFIPAAIWNNMMAGTKYTSWQLPAGSSRIVLLEVAGKKSGFCNKGIGFTCSIYDAPRFYNSIKINSTNRICPVKLSKQNNEIKLVFMNHMDWHSLQFD